VGTKFPNTEKLLPSLAHHYQNPVFWDRLYLPSQLKTSIRG